MNCIVISKQELSFQAILHSMLPRESNSKVSCVDDVSYIFGIYGFLLFHILPKCDYIFVLFVVI